MILGRGTNRENGKELLIIGLSAHNLAELIRGNPAYIRKEIHGNGVPDGWEILIIGGDTEESLAKDVLKCHPNVPIHEEPRLDPKYGRRN